MPLHRQRFVAFAAAAHRQAPSVQLFEQQSDGAVQTSADPVGMQQVFVPLQLFVQQLPLFVQAWPTGLQETENGLADAERADSVSTTGVT
jgi:hypothetical protein